MTIRPTKTHLNLLPESFRSRLRTRSRNRLWPLVWTVALAACVAAVMWQREGLHAARAEAESLRRKVTPLRAIEARGRALRRELADVARRNELVQSLERHRPPVRLVGVVSRCAAPLAAELSVDELRLEQRAVELPASSKKPAPRGAKDPAPGVVRHEVTILGTARDDVAVTQFIQSLRDSRMFHTVQLRSTRPTDSSADSHADSPDAPQRKYEVTCAY